MGHCGKQFTAGNINRTVCILPHKGVDRVLLFSTHQLAYILGDRTVFSDLNFTVELGEKTALVGPNGVGKTTLLRILSGSIRPTAGQVTYYKKVRTAMLVQDPVFPHGQTVAAVLRGALVRNGMDASGQVEAMLKQFGLAGLQDRPAAPLSGGEKTRLGLACVTALEPDLLLLDEPTSHLDTAHLDWLADFLREYRGTVLIVSHDRYFLDRTVTRVLELAPTGITAYSGNYTEYHRIKQARIAQDLKTYYDQEKQVKKLEQAIEQQKTWAARAHGSATEKARANCEYKEFYRAKAKRMDRQVKNTVKRLERMKKERIAKPKESVPVYLDFAGERRGNRLLLAEGLHKSYGTKTLFQGVDLTLRPGEKVALVGPNGAGKTTLLRIIMGQETPDQGKLWLSPSLRLGYLAQELQDVTKGESVLAEVGKVCADTKAVRNLLANLLFRRDDVYKPCAVLSMGERVRVALAKLLLGTYDLLLLDEPTNYLDLETREKLEEALCAFPGAIIIVSHDRYLLDRVCSTVWALEDRRLQTYPGNYSEYRAALSEKDAEPDQENQRLALEYRRSALEGRLATVDRAKEPEEYARLETEWKAVLAQLRSLLEQ